MQQAKKAQIISSETLHSGKWLTLKKEHFIKPDGSRGTYELIERRDVVMVMAEKDGKYFMVEQFRYAFNGNSIEFPQGFCEKNEKIEDAAKRELEEETGMGSNDIQLLTSTYPSTGFLRHRVHIFLATNLYTAKQKLDDTEGDLVLRLYSKNEIESLIRDNVIINMPTIAAFGMLLLQKS